MRAPVSFLIAVVLALGVSSARADRVQLRADAPDAYTVVKGDTLWDIAARFLKSPWKWPEVWQLNREAIKNPHLIYPGDRIRLIRGDSPQLVLEQVIPTVKLSPKVRAETLVQAEPGIPSVPYQAIAAFLNRGGVMAADELARAPRILGASDERVIFGAHDTVYADAGPAGVRDWQIVRAGPALIDPITGEVLGHQLVHIGEARTIKSGSPQLLRILHTQQEVLERDRLLPLQASDVPRFAPRAPDKPIEARVVAALGGVEGAGPYTTLVLNQGQRDGLEVGHVLALYKAGRSMADPRCARAGKLAFLAGGLKAESDCVPNKADTSALPDQRVGLAFVYRVFDRVAYALVMTAEAPIYVRDVAKTPED
ncbi:MAG: LysM peptidoglycan-binding domain-containing protein [Thiobacillaceae bacterium]